MNIQTKTKDLAHEKNTRMLIILSVALILSLGLNIWQSLVINKYAFEGGRDTSYYRNMIKFKHGNREEGMSPNYYNQNTPVSRGEYYPLGNTSQ